MSGNQLRARNGTLGLRPASGRSQRRLGVDCGPEEANRKLVGWEQARRPEDCMMPLVLCSAYSQQDFTDASVVVGCAIVLGWLAARQAKPLWIWICCLVGLLLPTAALLGIWPFDPSWKDDCGATPDPAILTTGAAMMSPLLLGAAYLASKWLNQFRRREG